MASNNFHILFRKPKYPLIIISSEKLLPAFDIQELAQNCVNSAPRNDEKHIIAIDSTGEEFWYTPESFVISPSFLCKKWTKKRIVEMYNNSPNSKELNQKYSTKSLSAKKLDKIVLDVCNLLE